MVAVEALGAAFGNQHLMVEGLHRVALEDAFEQASTDSPSLPVRMHEDVRDVDGERAIGHCTCVSDHRAVVGAGDE